MTTSDPAIEPRAGADARGRRIGIAIAVVIAGLIVVNLVARGLDRAVGGNQPGGATGSSYATAPDGLAAFATLLSHYGHDIQQQRGSLAQQPLPPHSTAFVLEPRALTTDDETALLEFVSAGGRLVVGGRAPFYLRRLRDQPPVWQNAGSTLWTNVDPSLGDLHNIEAAGTGSWSATGSGRAVVGVDTFSLVTNEHVGSGEIFFIADASPLENAYLGAGDNAAFGLALAGDPSRPIVFPEGVHGYGARSGLSAIPGRWKVALLLVGLAALAFVLSRARRFGPPDHAARDLPPARAEYMRALSVTLERTHDRAGALTPAQRWARARLAARAGLGARPNDEELTRAARSFGCTGDEIVALLTPVADDASVLALGRAVSRIGGDGRIQ